VPHDEAGAETKTMQLVYVAGITFDQNSNSVGGDLKEKNGRNDCCRFGIGMTEAHAIALRSRTSSRRDH